MHAASAGPARAAELKWSAPDGCGSEAELRTRIEHNIHAALEDAVALELEAAVEVTADGKWQLRVHTPLEQGGRVRELTLASCAEAIDAAVVSISMAISAAEPTAPASPPPPAAAPEPVTQRRSATRAGSLGIFMLRGAGG